MSTSFQPSSDTPATPAWRAAVIGVVAVLAVGIGVAAGTFLLATRAAAVGDGASYVPASAPFYFEMRLEPSAGQDAALRDFLGRFPPIDGVDLERPLYEQMTERIDEMLAAEDAGVSWSGDVAPWFDGRVGVALMGLPLDAMTGPIDPMTAPETPPMVVLVGVTDATLARTAIERVIASTDAAPVFTDQSHAGVTIHVADEGAYAITDDQLLIAPDADDIMTALDANASGTTTLSAVGEITRLTERLPADWLAFGVYDFTELMSAAVSEAATASPGMADAFGALFEHQPMRGAMAMTVAGDRVAIDAVSEPPSGPLAVENAERGLAAEVPGDVLYYSEAGNLGPALAAVIEPMKDALASMPAGEEQLDTIEAALGADLEELVSWIDDGALAFGWDGGEPYGGMVLVPNDMSAAERRLDQLATFAGLAGMDASTGVSVEESQVGSVSVTTIRWEDPNAQPEALLPMPTALAVQYAVTDDRAVIGLGESFVGRVLELDASDALASVQRFSESVDALGGSSNAGVAWVDLAGIREAVETAMGPMLGLMDPDGAYESTIRPWLLPLDRMVAVTRLEDDLLVQRSALLVE